MIHIVTIVDANYWRNKMGPWAESVVLHSNVPSHVVTLGFEISPADRAKYKGIDFRELEFSELRVNNECNIVQEGGWLAAFPDADERDVFIVVDGDVIMQRPIAEGEINLCENLDYVTLGMYWNAGEGDHLGLEAARIHPQWPMDLIRRLWCPNGWLPCCNGGVIVARIGCWKHFYDKYCRHWPDICNDFTHIARAQWLINWCAQTPPFRLWMLPKTFHQHGHYGIQPGVRVDGGGVVFVGDARALFRHKIGWSPAAP